MSAASIPETVTVIGVGKLGLCLALLLENAGYAVEAVDKNEAYIETLRSGKYQTSEPHVVNMLRKQQNIRWHSSLSRDIVDRSTIICVLVDTPYRSQDVPYDTQNVDRVLSQLRDFNLTGKCIVINSTVFPQYCESRVNWIPGNDLLYSPEFIAQGSIIYGLRYPDMVLIGSTSKEGSDKLADVYKRVISGSKRPPVICQMSLTEAEITKLAVNTFLTSKISFANYIGDIASAVGANAETILDAVGNDSRIGHKYLKAGFGYGGPCLVRDNSALGSFSDKIGSSSIINRATDNYNEFHTQLQIKQLLEHDSKPFAFEGSVTYKTGCALLDNSQQLRIAKAMLKSGKKIHVVDLPEVIDQVKKDPVFVKYVDHVEFSPSDLGYDM